MGVYASLRAGGAGLGLERYTAYRGLRKLIRALWRPVYVAPISLADFGVGRRPLARAIDLLFVCTR